MCIEYAVIGKKAVYHGACCRDQWQRGSWGGRQDIGFFAQHREMTPYPLEIDLAS